MNTVHLVQSKWCPKSVTLTVHRTYCIHTLMNVRKMNFISYIYTLFLHVYSFCSLFDKFWSKSCKISSKVKLLNDMFGYHVKQPSPWLNVNRTLHQPINYFICLWRCLCITSCEWLFIGVWTLFVQNRFISSKASHAQPSSGARCLIFGWVPRLLPYFMCANSEGSGTDVQTRLSLRWSPMW